MRRDSKHLQPVGALVAVTLLTLAAGLGGPTGTARADSLYVGDAADSTVKRFDATTPNLFLGEFVGSGGLHGPMGLVFTQGGGDLLVSDQNVNRSIPGEILEYSDTGKLLRKLIPHSGRNAPAIPRGIVLWQNALFVAEFSQEFRKFGPFTSGRLLKYTKEGAFLAAYAPAQATLGSGEFHPRGIVVGPDGLIYLSNVLQTPPGVGGQVLRFDPAAGRFLDAPFVSNDPASPPADDTRQLNRPEGLVFGPNGKLYVTSFRADANDNDKILIFQGPNGASPGAYAGRIQLDQVGQPRSAAQALLFGPGGVLFVPISNATAPPVQDSGAIRRYDVDGNRLPPDFVAAGGALVQPWYLTFGQTNPGTLAYGP